MQLRISGIINDSIVDGPGLRLTVFTQGCLHNCPGCHNPQTHDISGGYFIDTDEIIDKIKANPLLQGVTLSGGDPFLQCEPLYELMAKINELRLNTIIYTGFTWEELMENESFKKLALMADYIVDSKFIEELKTLDIAFVGSSNQRIIDVKKTIETGELSLRRF